MKAWHLIALGTLMSCTGDVSRPAAGERATISYDAGASRYSITTTDGQEFSALTGDEFAETSKDLTELGYKLEGFKVTQTSDKSGVATAAAAVRAYWGGYGYGYGYYGGGSGGVGGWHGGSAGSGGAGPWYRPCYRGYCRH